MLLILIQLLTGRQLGRILLNGTTYQIYDMKLYLMKYYITESVLNETMALLSGPGIELPFSNVVWSGGSFPANTQNQIVITCQGPQYSNLEAVIIVFRRKEDQAGGASTDFNMLRTMNTTHTCSRSNWCY